MNVLKNVIAFSICLTCIIAVAQTNTNVKVVNSRVQKLEEVVDKNEYNARLSLRNAKIAYQNLMIDKKNGTISGKKFEKKEKQIMDAMNKGREALKVIYEAKGLLPKK